MKMSADRIADMVGYNHVESVEFFNQLLLDLKKQLLGVKPHEPITMDRLNEGSAHINDLMKCTHELKKY